MRAVICSELLACTVRVVLDYLRGSAAAGCDLRRSKSIRQMLQHFDLSDTQGFIKAMRCSKVILKIPASKRLTAQQMCGSMEGGPLQRPFLLWFRNTRI
jgi:hypothetical protein